MPATILSLLSIAAPETSDAELLGRFVASRDEAAFAELVRRHGPPVYRVCRRLVGSSAADDAFQSTFLVLACRAKSVREAASVGSWLIGVAGRVARQMRKRDWRAGGVSPLLESQYPQQPAHSDRSPEVAELAAILDDELTRLPDALRAPVVLCLVEGRTQEQAATALGGSVRTLRRRLDRAKAVLRARLERRGVLPSVAAAMVTGIGSAVAVPPGLSDRAVNGVFEFLAGGVPTPAAILAKGIVMGTVKLKVGGLVAVAATVMIGLGVGWAGNPPLENSASQPLTPPLANTPPALPGITTDQAQGNRPAGQKEPGRPRATHLDQVFTVHAPTAVMGRAIAAEARYLHTNLAVEWLGKSLPYGVSRRTITFTEDLSRSSGSTSFEFKTDPKSELPKFTSAIMELRGPFLQVLEDELPHQITHMVLADHFGKPLPRWADEGIAELAVPKDAQARLDAKCRELLDAGRGLRLRVLFPMTDYPRDLIIPYSQGHSVCRFLLTLDTRELIPLHPGGVVDGGISPVKQLPKPRQLIRFIEYGLSDGWDVAAAKAYGFGSVDKLESAWIEWLKTPESRLDAKPAAPKEEKPDLIPPTKLPGR